ncbi:MAG: hypothetical protein LBK64_06330, partial [Spirochaetaceae bacterium]|nr:hypothetical protein [Spirochaetaceae bacterium]
IETPIPINGTGDWTTALATINTTPGHYIVTVSGDSTGLTPGSITSASKVSLRGTGSLALGSTNGSLITVGTSATLILRGPTLKGKTGNNKAVVTVEDSGAEFIMNAGIITGNTLGNGDNGGGVTVRDGAEFTMNGGAIRGNHNTSDNSTGAGGVFVSDAEFTMNGGIISGNTSQPGGGGGGVHVENELTTSTKFTMKGGTIRDNTGSGAGGVYVNHHATTFEMSGGTISGNSAEPIGGGVYAEEGTTFTMSGGTISGNTSKDIGGGVIIAGTFTMSGGIISGNTVTGLGLGGGVAAAGDASFTKNGGIIYGDTDATHTPGSTENTATSAASGSGHAVCVIEVVDKYQDPPIINVVKYRDATAGPGDNMDTTDDDSDATEWDG